MEWIRKTNILIVGLGLIGGSYAKGLRRFGYRVTAIDPRKEGIDYALEHGLIERGYTEACEEAISDADVLILALYPGILKDWVAENKKYIKKGALVTDVTGVKSCVVYDVQKELDGIAEFIAAHPMAGRELSGVENSDEKIFQNANYIVTPTDKNTEDAIEWCRRLGMILGFSHIAILTPEEHDEMIAFVSQLTHCIAVSLMTCNQNPHLSEYTGDSFRDLTRIARINDRMWSELFLVNKDALLKEMDAFLTELQDMREMLVRNDEEGLRKKMRLSTERRALFDKK